MQLLTFCLLVIVGHMAMGAPLQIQLKLDEIRIDLGRLNRTVTHRGLKLNTPQTEDIKACCSGLALQCFSEKLSELETSQKDAALKKRLVKSLQNNFVQKSVNPCNEEDTKSSACLACDAYPLRDSRIFVRAFETLLQKSCDTIVRRQ